MRVRADAVLELAAKLGCEVEDEAVLAAIAALPRVLELVGGAAAGGELSYGGCQEELDGEVLGREAVALHANNEVPGLREAEVLPRQRHGAQLHARPGGGDALLP